MIRKLVLLCSCGLTSVALNINLARGADLPALEKLLAPAYTAMSLARLCETNTEWSASEPRGAKGTATNYAEFAKDAVIESLTQEQSLSVLKFAAEAARTEARKQLHEKVIVEDKSEEAVRFKSWCDDYVKNFVANVIDSIERNQYTFLQQLRQAKQSEKPQ